MEKKNINAAVARFQYLMKIIPKKLGDVSETEFNFKAGKSQWSKKEILGHLIDSAANNHQRFIRIQYEDVPTIAYDQNKWNALNHYQELESRHVIHLWAIYNVHLLEVIKRIPLESLGRECNTAGKENVTLQFVIEDYVEHMEHHLKQILSY